MLMRMPRLLVSRGARVLTAQRYPQAIAIAGLPAQRRPVAPGRFVSDLAGAAVVAQDPVGENLVQLALTDEAFTQRFERHRSEATGVDAVINLDPMPGIAR
ncbi:hypothetical protein P43SY_007131 [Pythium insidiosum]|uniref:Uncharacterized protein n=1 Tax=Pythium insidiosum TaxID=114742 RepID=A0AAD5LMQ8_PYTIN|nr:hypothetical protein P43SY_007131 [Pythium insidiosum]